MSQPTEHSQTNETRQPELKLQSLPRALGSRELQHRPAKEEQQLCPQHLPDRPELPAWGLGGLQEDCARAVALTATQTSVEGGTARTLAEPQISIEPPAGPTSTGRLWAEEM